MGRPFIDLTEEDLRKMSALAGLGLTLPKIAAVMGFSESVLAKRKQTSDAVKTALERGKAEAEMRIGKSLFERAIDGDVAAIRWWEMTRAGRTVEQRLETRQTTTATITVQTPDWTALVGGPAAGSDDAPA